MTITLQVATAAPTGATTSDWITLWGIAGTLFITIVSSAVFLIFRTGRIVESILAMQESLKDLPKLKYSYGQMNVKVDTLWRNHLSQSNSPMILNDTGLKILETSKIEEFTNQYYQEILDKVKATSPANAYQAQESLIRIVSEYQNNTDCKLRLEEAAFNSGYDVNSVLFVAAIHIRDKVISDLGFDREDIDKHDPKKNIKKTSQ